MKELLKNNLKPSKNQGSFFCRFEEVFFSFSVTMVDVVMKRVMEGENFSHMKIVFFFFKLFGRHLLTSDLIL